uniref:Uncharacterized protein n=1 Tax=Babesia bovis TaxID=5865 RepID=S6BGL5_BABBO|nr:hypothetical protein [Babesia bovis]
MTDAWFSSTLCGFEESFSSNDIFSIESGCVNDIHTGYILQQKLFYATFIKLE